MANRRKTAPDSEQVRKISTSGRRKIINSMLKRALRRKGISISMLAERMGLKAGTVQHWFYGIHVPPAKYAAALADALDSSALEQWIDALYTHNCQICQSVFRSEGFSSPRKYCSDDCRRIANKVGPTKLSPAASRDRDLLVIYKRSVAAFCHECARSPVCPNSLCELRPASPLKTQEDIALMRPERRPTQWSDQRRKDFSVHMKKVWADPVRNERRVAAVREGVSMLGEEVRKDRSRKAKENWARLPEDEKQRRIARLKKKAEEQL